MKPEPNFFLINRTLLDHSWLTTNRNWQLGWIYVIGRANYQNGRVSLTEVYRELTDLFTLDQWRYFVKRCAREGMLLNVIAANQGDKAGYRQMADVANYARYQGRDMSHLLEDVYQNGAKTERAPGEGRSDKALPTHLSDVETEPKRSAHGAKTESNKEYSKELKELKPSRGSSQNQKALKARTQGHEFDPATVDLPSHFDRERFVDFCEVRLGKKDPMSALALKRFVAKHQNNSAAVLDQMFDNAIVSGWKDLYPLKPWEREEVERSAPQKPKADRLPPGTPVHHPVWGDDVIRYYRETDGQIVLDACGALVKPNEVVPCPN